MKGTIYIILIIVTMLCIYLVSLPTVKEHFLISDLKEKLTIIDNRFKDLDIRADILPNIYDSTINAEILVCRAFKKLDQVIQVSREIVKGPHKLMILKGKNAQDELNKAFKTQKYPYKLEKSITDSNSKIIIINFN